MIKNYTKNPFHIKVKLLLVLFFAFFSLAVKAQKEVAATKLYLNENTAKYNLSLADIADMKVSSQYLSPTTGWYHIYFNQTFEQVEVYNGLLSVTLKDDKVAYAANSFIQNLLSKIPENKTAVLSTKLALQKAVADVSLTGYDVSKTKELRAENLGNGKLSKVVYEDKQLSNEKIDVKLYWLPVENNIGEKINTNLALTWNVRFVTKDGQHSWNIHVDANTGNIIQKKDDVVHCDFGKPDHENHTALCLDNKIETPNLSSLQQMVTMYLTIR